MYISSFFKDEDIRIEHIQNRLECAMKMLNAQNKLNLTDINIICEEIFGKILNELYGYNLKSVFADLNANCTAIDLYDENKRIAFQITSQKSKNKIIETIDKFKKHNLVDHYDNLYFLILVDHVDREWDTDSLKKFKSINFDPNNILYLNNIVNDIAKQDTSKLPTFYSYINMVFDSGRLKYNSIVDLTSEFEKEFNMDSLDFTLYTCGFGDARIRVIVPHKNINKFACSIEFRKNDISGSEIHLNLETLRENYFLSEKDFYDRHCEQRNIYNHNTMFRMENLIFYINANTVYHIFLLFKKIEERYLRCLNDIKNNMSVD